VSALVQPATPDPSGFGARAATTVLDVVIPVYNEEAQLADSVGRVLEHLHAMPWSFQVTIADNASTDQTALIARRLSHAHPEVSVVHLAEKGRGRALKRAWSASDSDVLVYMDVDLSTDLGALLPLVAPLVSGHSDLAIGSRLARTSRVRRGAKRELISRSYNLILRQALRARFSDAQCGFKAIRRDAARELLPLVEDDAWFFDTELLIVAERAGLRIHEVPVDWTDDPDSRVDIVRTAVDDLKGIGRLGRSLVRGTLPLSEIGERLGRTSAEAGRGRLGMQVGLFLVIGVFSTLAYALLYLGLRTSMGPWWANFTALLATALVNTAANRRFTFGVRGPRDVVRHQVQGLLIFAAGLLATSGSLALLHAAGSSGRAAEVVVLTTANLAVTILRFVAMKLWVFAVVEQRAKRVDGRDRPVITQPLLSPRASVSGSPAATPTGSRAARRE
jgi:glycosyltransferase involved in cell wall biosynthesis